MHLVFADEHLIDTLTAILTGAGDGLFWKLFESNTVPTAASVLADFTFADDSWGEIQVAPGDFSLSQVSAHQASMQAPNIVFTNTTGAIVQVYGYAIVNPAKTKILAAARFDDAPIALDLGSALPVVPVIGSQSYYET